MITLRQVIELQFHYTSKSLDQGWGQLHLHVFKYNNHIGVLHIGQLQSQQHRLLFGVNEKLLTQHILGPVTKYKLCKSATRVGQGLGPGVGLGLGLWVSARG